MTTFPIIDAHISGRTKTNFDLAMKAVERATEEGYIANPIFISTKQAIGRAIEDAWRNAILEKYTYNGKWESLPADLRSLEIDMGYPSAHNGAGLVKRIEKARLSPADRAHPMFGAMLDFAKECAGLGDLINGLKEKVVKRQPKPVEDRKAKYLAPAASGSAKAKVQKLLMDLTQDVRADLTKEFVTDYNNYLTEFLVAQKDDSSLTPYGYFRRTSGSRRNMNMEAYQLVASVTTSVHNQPTTVRQDAQEIIKQKAEQVAEEICNGFVYKNMAKLDSIIEKKGDFDAKVLHTQVRRGVEGDIQFKFHDGSEFIVKLQAVLSHSVHGVRFLRWPVTFHNVKLANGEKMKTPNEEKMNTIFVQ